ncbi:MAG: MFS transporter [Chloroflexi bacterium]|nr:MFS transporter [Chloroflexota bacterium]
MAEVRSAAMALVEAQPRYRWVMLALVWMLYTCFGLIARAPAPLVDDIVADLGLSYTQMGTVLGAWQLSYIAFALLAGLAMDRFGLRRTLFFGGLVIALSGLLRATVTSFETLFLAVALFGVGGPMISVGAPKIVATWFRGNERGTAAGVYSTGSNFGSILALAATTPLVMPVTGHWRPTLAVYGAVALLAAFAWALLARSPSGAAAGGDKKGGSVRALLHIPTIWAVLIVGLAVFVTSHGLNNWLPKMLAERGYTPAEAGLWSALPQAAGMVGALWLGRVAPAGRRRRALIGLLVVSAVSTLAIGILSGALFATALLVYGVTRALLTPLLMLIIIETPGVGAGAMGAAGGLYFTVGEIGGFGGPFLMGYLADQTGNFLTGIYALAAGNLIMLTPTFFVKERQPER